MVRQVPRSLGELRVLRMSGARSGERHAQPVEASCHASRVLRQVTVIVPERHDVILPGDSCPRRARAVAHGLTPEPRCLPGPRGRATDRTICSWEWGPCPLLGAPVSPPLPKTRHRRPLRAAAGATPSLLMLSARFLTDETRCEAEAGLRRPPVELCSTLGVRQLCAHPGWGRARRR